MVGVIGDEICGHPVHVFGGDSAALGLQPPLDQLAGAGADHVAGGGYRHGRQAFAVEHVVQRGDQVGRRIHKRAVEIEDDGVRGGHGPSATGPVASTQGAGP